MTLQQSSYNACGMLLGAITQVTRFLGSNPQSSIVMVGEVLISKKFDTIVEFSAFEDFRGFEKNSKNKVERVENN